MFNEVTKYTTLINQTRKQKLNRNNTKKQYPRFSSLTPSLHQAEKKKKHKTKYFCIPPHTLILKLSKYLSSDYFPSHFEFTSGAH